MKNLQPDVSTCTPVRSKRPREPCRLSLVLVHDSLIHRHELVSPSMSPVTQVSSTCQASQGGSWQHLTEACPTQPQVDNKRPNRCAANSFCGKRPLLFSSKSRSQGSPAVDRVSSQGQQMPPSHEVLGPGTGRQAGSDAARNGTKMADRMCNECKTTRILCDEDVMLLSQYGYSDS